MKILLATDGSEYSHGAANFLTRLNLSFEDEITIFHTVYWIPVLYGRESYHETLKAIKKEIAPRIIDSLLDILKPVNAKISTLIQDGSPEYCIVDAAVDADADLIVLGARGVKGIEPYLIGSVARAVAIKSPKPTLVVKLPAGEVGDEMKILFAADGSQHSISTGNFLSAMPLFDNAEITVVNVVPWDLLDVPASFASELHEKFAEIIEDGRSARLAESQMVVELARETLSKRFRKVNALSTGGDPFLKILKISEDLHTDCIVLGCRGLRGIRGMMGSLSRNILTHAKCSVLIGKVCEP